MAGTRQIAEEETVTTTISGVPTELLEQIDELAAAERRTRSAFLVKAVEEIVAKKKRKASPK